jgi:hypothetical protein
LALIEESHIESFSLLWIGRRRFPSLGAAPIFLSLTADNVEPPQLLGPLQQSPFNQPPDDRNMLLAKLTVTVFEE